MFGLFFCFPKRDQCPLQLFIAADGRILSREIGAIYLMGCAEKKQNFKISERNILFSAINGLESASDVR
jgi:hypothetical protein